MGSIVTSLSSSFKQKKEYKVCILGLDGAGKSSIVLGLCNTPIVPLGPTIGFNVEEIRVSGITLKLWDIGGQSEFRQHWQSHLLRCTALILVIDSNDEKRIELIDYELTKVSCNVPTRTTLLVFANKQDLEPHLTVDEIEHHLSLKSSAFDYNIFACNALSKEGIKEGFDWLLSSIQKKNK